MPKRLLQARNTLTINKDRISRKNVRDKEHIIISGVAHMIGDAVMNKIHYPMAETQSLSNSLGNKRVVMPSSHPLGDNGEFISASDPLALMSNFVGAFAFNFSIKDDRLISDVAIDPVFANTSANGKQIIDAINAGEAIDVSTAFYLNVEDVEGFGSDGEPFTGVASNLCLDHIAFLPNESGAKNKIEGIGLNTNSAIDVDGNELDTDIAELFNNASTPAMSLPLAPKSFTWNESAALNRIKKFTNSETKPSTNFRKFFLNFDQTNVDSFGSYTGLFADIIDGVPHAVKSPIESAVNNDNAEKYNQRFAANKDGVLSKTWNVIKSLFTNDKHELSHDNISDKIREKLNEGRSDGDRHFWPIDVFDTYFVYRADGGTLFRQSYAMTDDEIVFIGERTEVERVVEYKKFTNDNGDRVMRKKLIQALNAAGVKTENLDDDAILTAYNKLHKDDEGLTEEEILKRKKKKKTVEPKSNSGDDKVLSAINSLGDRLDKMQSDINTNSDKELNELAKQVVNLDIGLTEDVAKVMGVNSCKDVLAKNGVAAFNTGGAQYQHNNQESDRLDMKMPGGEK